MNALVVLVLLSSPIAPGAGTIPPAPEPARTVWDELADCESGEWNATGHVEGSARWDLDTGNGYFGGVQFSPRSWRWVGGTGLPHEHPREEQVRRAEILLERQGWRAWPVCSRRLGLRP